VEYRDLNVTVTGPGQPELKNTTNNNSHLCGWLFDHLISPGAVLQYQKAPMLSIKMSSRLACQRMHCRYHRHQRHLHQYIRSMSVYGFGQQWSGALSRGSNNLFLEEAPELSSDELQQFDKCQNMISLKGINDKKCLAASVGWGHTALLVVPDNNTTNTVSPKLMICGRPHDFQTLMRLRRLPPFMRNFCIKHTLPSEEEDNDYQQSSKGKDSDTNAVYEPSILQRIATYFAGDNEATFNEEECRRYSNVPTLLEINLPNNEIPALEGTKLSNTSLEFHASAKISQHTSQPFNTHFQNTLATCAGVTACISQTGHLYTFGLNQRGQCGVGTFTPNIWTPCQVSGLANTRFILDNGTGIDEEIYRTFKDQQYPIVSVALGLQHGVALDSEGQVFCWGKGERGQLGQGRRMMHDDSDEETVGSDAPNENRTFEYAIQVSNFYDPFATKSTSPNDIYAPSLSKDDARIRLISAGMNFTVAVTNSNLPYIWGKNVCLDPTYSDSSFDPRSKEVQDSTYPRYISGLPSDLRIERVACGTHHASMLLEDGSIWAVGIATDKPKPLWDEAVEILAPGVVDMNELVSFTAGFDRTSVVYGSDRRQVIEVQLWSTEELREHGAVRPSWVEWLEQEKGREKVCSTHRGWMHSIVVTEE